MADALQADIDAWHEQLEEQQYGPKNRPAKPNVQVALGNEEPVAGRRIQFAPEKTVRNIYKHGRSLPHGVVSHKTRTKRGLYLNSMANLQRQGIFQDILALMVADASSKYEELKDMLQYILSLQAFPGAVLARYPALEGVGLHSLVKKEVVLKLIEKYVSLLHDTEKADMIARYKHIMTLARITEEQVSELVNRLRTPENRAYADEVIANAMRQIAENQKPALPAGSKRKAQALNSGRNNKKATKRRGRRN